MSAFEKGSVLEAMFCEVPCKNFGFSEFHANLDNFFARIGYTGSREPTLGLLREVHYRFQRTFAFENLSIHGLCHQDSSVQPPVSVDPAIIEQKLLHKGRGGYCFEINQYLFLVLRELGFKIVPKTGRVLFGTERGTASPRTHLISLVFIDGKVLICDVGFGGASFPVPIELLCTEPVYSVYDTHRVIPAPDIPIHHYLVQVLRRDLSTSEEGEVPDPWMDMYVFDSQEISTIADWDCANYQVSMRPKTLFRENVIVVRMHETGRYMLVNRKFISQKCSESAITIDNVSSLISSPNSSEDDSIVIDDPNELVNILRSRFLIEIPEDKAAELAIPATDKLEF